MITATQSRLARAALGWAIHNAARAAGLASNTVARFEVGHETKSATLRKLREAYEAAGVTFVAVGEASLSGGEGVRFVPKASE